MNQRTIVLGSIFLLVVLGLLYWQFMLPYLQNRTVETVSMVTIPVEAASFEFSYPSGEAGFTLIEPPVDLVGREITKTFILMETAPYILFQNDTETTETPPSISIFVLPLPEASVEEENTGRITRLQNWAQANSQLSSFAQITSETEVVEIDGVKALHYFTDGLYQQEVYLASYQGNVYIFTGQYPEGEDAIQATFSDLIKSVVFY